MLSKIQEDNGIVIITLPNSMDENELSQIKEMLVPYFSKEIKGYCVDFGRFCTVSSGAMEDLKQLFDTYKDNLKKVAFVIEDDSYRKIVEIVFERVHIHPASMFGNKIEALKYLQQ